MFFLKNISYRTINQYMSEVDFFDMNKDPVLRLKYVEEMPDCCKINNTSSHYHDDKNCFHENGSNHKICDLD